MDLIRRVLMCPMVLLDTQVFRHTSYITSY